MGNTQQKMYPSMVLGDKYLGGDWLGFNVLFIEYILILPGISTSPSSQPYPPPRKLLAKYPYLHP